MYDALVIGAGAMGSATLFHLAARGLRVAAIDSLNPPHKMGSTHGRTRIIREAYYEHPAYVPLVRQAYRNWDLLGGLRGTPLFTRTGALMIGLPDSELIRGTLTSAVEHGIDVERLTAVEVMGRFPCLHVEPGMVGVLEQNAGVLDPEACVSHYLAVSLGYGAQVLVNRRVTGLKKNSGVVEVETTEGSMIAKRVALCAGAWNPVLLNMLGESIPLKVERQTMHWFSGSGDASLLAPSALPVVMIEYDTGRFFYAIPDMGDGVKAAIHHEGAFGAPDLISRDISRADTDPVNALASRFIPQIAGRIRDSVVCLYTDTPSRDFIVDALPGAPEVTLVSACSGHGFKFASAIGEVASQIMLGESPSVDISRFRIACSPPG